MFKTFLQAEWRKLVMANYAVDSKLLAPYLPYKTEIDFWHGRCYVSLVGFMFLNTKVLGTKIPFHSNFEEVNLRFYVRYRDKGAWKRGVVFIQEIVPRPALTMVARLLYRENYITLPMGHSWEITNQTIKVEYNWKKESRNSISVVADGVPDKIREASEEAFITEHYWGYTRVSDQKTSEYKVEHPKWDVYKVNEYSIDVNYEDVYGKDFAFLSTAKPISVFLAEGSAVKVKTGKAL